MSLGDFINKEEKKKVTEGKQQCLSLIALGKYKEALGEAKNNSFEKAYCYYKLGKYKAAIKTAGKREGRQWESIRMQSYYSLNRYTDAIREGDKIYKINGESLVNYSAAVAMAAVAGENVEEEARRCREAAESSEEYVRAETMYNLALMHMPKRDKTVEELQKIETTDTECAESIKAQIATLEQRYKDVPVQSLLKRNREIHQYNITGEEAPGLVSNMKVFQREIYNKEKLRMYSRTKSVPKEIKEFVESLKKKECPKAMEKIVKMPRRNIQHLIQILAQEKVSTRFIKRYLKHTHINLSS